MLSKVILSFLSCSLGVCLGDDVIIIIRNSVAAPLSVQGQTHMSAARHSSSLCAVVKVRCTASLELKREESD